MIREKAVNYGNFDSNFTLEKAERNHQLLDGCNENSHQTTSKID